MTGVVILDKPLGISSNQALGRVKRLLGEPKGGFLGTLDPLATGVLAIFLGKATKLIEGFEGLDKTYRVRIKLGERTDTQDAEGAVIERRELGGLDAERVRRTILATAGEQPQSVPRFSAVKHGGVPAYKLARRGLPVPERVRTVRLWDVEVLDVALPHAEFRVTCTAGTYMRSLADQIGETLGVGAHVVELRREACGRLFTLENSITLTGIGERLAKGDAAFLHNPAEFLTDHHPVTVGDESERSLREGRAIPAGAGAPAAGANAKAVRPCGTLIAVGKVVANGPQGLRFQPTKVLI